MCTNMRLSVVALSLSFATLTAGAAFASPPGAPTPPNPDKVIRPVTPAVAKTPKVSYETAALAAHKETFPRDPTKRLPVSVLAARQEIQVRDAEVEGARTQFHSESTKLWATASELAHPVRRVEVTYPDRRGVMRTKVRNEPLEPTVEELAQAAEGFVSAAQVLVNHSAGLSQRVARENPDPGAKKKAAEAMAEDYHQGANMYHFSADAEDHRAKLLASAGRHAEAAAAREKANNTRAVAKFYEKKSAEIAEKGVPGADGYTLPSELKLSAN